MVPYRHLTRGVVQRWQAEGDRENAAANRHRPLAFLGTDVVAAEMVSGNDHPYDAVEGHLCGVIEAHHMDLLRAF